MKKHERTKTVTIRVSEEELMALDAYAIAKDIPKSIAIRHLITKEIKAFKESGGNNG